MGYIQLAQPLTQQFGKIIVIVDMRKELTVSRTHLIPIHSVHIQVIEAFLLLLIYMVKHSFPFGSQIHLHLRLITNRFQRIRLCIHLLHIPTAQQEYISIFIHR